MPSLSQGSATSVVVTNGQYVSMKNGPRDKARLELASGAPVVKNHNGLRVYGPFAAQTLRIASPVGTLTYSSGALASVAPMGRL
jgi:hypothetical protein